MRQHGCPVVSMGVACALLAPTFVLAQVTKEEVLILELPAPKRAQVQKQIFKPGRLPADFVPVMPAPAHPNLPAERLEVRPIPFVPVMPALGHPNMIDNADPLIEQLIEQYRPVMRVEYHFIRSVCELTEEQRKQVAREAERTLGDVARRYAEIRRGGQLRRPGVPPTPLPDIRKLIQDGLADVVAARLTPEQVTRYRVEVAWRAEQRRRAVVENLMAKLDQDLILSAKQRADLSASLITHWSDSWFPTPAMMLNAEHYLPRVPSQYILPFLNETQREVWQGVFRNQVLSGTLFGFSPLQDDIPEDDDLAEAREAAADREERK